MKVAILGFGPAGAMAAYAAYMNGADVKIFAPGQKSIISGAQYLHDEIPGLDVPPMELDYRKFGTQEGYASKVYGDPKAPCSWSEFGAGKTLAYPLAAAYDAAWAAVQARLVCATVTARQLAQMRSNFDLVVCSVPKPSVCSKPGVHRFEQKTVWIHGSEPPLLEGKIPHNTIVYNGEPDDAWYRTSNIEGNCSTEYPTSVGTVSSAHATRKIGKPLTNTCDCFPDVLRVGRYGKWKKGVLVHNAYWEVEYAVQQMQ